MQFLRVVSISIFLLLMFPGLSAHAEDKSATDEANKLIKQFSDALKSELQTAIQSGGLIKGIEVCSEKAPAIAAQFSQSPWQIKRTSLKVRNPLNKPTAFEEDILRQFQVKKDEGIELSDLSYYQSEKTETGITHRFMKAIPTQGLCLACHGENISEPVKEALANRYPNDQATGFHEGDIRGAFSLIYEETVK